MRMYVCLHPRYKTSTPIYHKRDDALAKANPKYGSSLLAENGNEEKKKKRLGDLGNPLVLFGYPLVPFPCYRYLSTCLSCRRCISGKEDRSGR